MVNQFGLNEKLSVANWERFIPTTRILCFQRKKMMVNITTSVSTKYKYYDVVPALEAITNHLITNHRRPEENDKARS